MRVFLIVLFFTLSAAAQPYIGDLAPGESFTLSKETPILEDINPSDPMAAISEMKYLPEGTVFEVIKLGYQNSDTNKNRPWYAVEIKAPPNLEGTKGWINSRALFGQ